MSFKSGVTLVASVRKTARQTRALARYPKSWKSRKGKRTEEAWMLERDRLIVRVPTNQRGIYA